jgi:hypothetical protein
MDDYLLERNKQTIEDKMERGALDPLYPVLSLLLCRVFQNLYYIGSCEMPLSRRFDTQRRRIE